MNLTHLIHSAGRISAFMALTAAVPMIATASPSTTGFVRVSAKPIPLIFGTVPVVDKAAPATATQKPAPAPSAKKAAPVTVTAPVAKKAAPKTAPAKAVTGTTAKKTAPVYAKPKAVTAAAKAAPSTAAPKNSPAPVARKAGPAAVRTRPYPAPVAAPMDSPSAYPGRRQGLYPDRQHQRGRRLCRTHLWRGAAVHPNRPGWRTYRPQGGSRSL